MELHLSEMPHLLKYYNSRGPIRISCVLNKSLFLELEKEKSSIKRMKIIDNYVPECIGYKLSVSIMPSVTASRNFKLDDPDFMTEEAFEKLLAQYLPPKVETAPATHFMNMGGFALKKKTKKKKSKSKKTRRT